ncbi:MAG: Hsp70 family protein, partial [Leptospiraceae bacterium]|nr:Hsp70 family protein [Leptospiraceae bacterium]
IPTKKTQIFSTAADNQTAVSIHVLQGEREMARDNRTLGRFDLIGIPPAPKGVPQIEVTFDIDANGILHVSAKDLGTGKEQRIRIESSSRLSEEEIQRMIKEAEANAAADKRAREIVETKNDIENLIYTLEKTLKEAGDKISSSDKQLAEDEIKRARDAMGGDDLSRLQTARESLNKIASKIGTQIYEKSGARATGATSGNNAQSEGGEKVVDADYTVVDDKK